MSNGGSRLIFNTRERSISSDYNRLQDMQARARAVWAARLFDDRYTAGLPGVAGADITGGDTPIRADVYGGLFVKVDDPNSLFVDPGVVGVVHPDATPGLDDDPYKLIDDPGLQTAGILTFLANGGGAPRIDLVVASVVEPVLETDSRDILDPGTGLFAPQTVNKVMAKRLSYSIVRGVAGAGMPALTNVIVLAVASVPPSAADWSDVTFWDVRPLVQDRAPGFGRNRDVTARYDFNFDCNTPYSNTGVMRGEAWSEYAGYAAGGVLRKSTPTAVMGTGDVDLDLRDPENATNDADIVAGDVGAVPVFALFPSGLPRWCRYSEGAAPGLSIRAPYGPRGILVAGRRTEADKAKVNLRGFCTGVALPASTGLTGTADGVCLAVMHVNLNVTSDPQITPAWGRRNRVMFAHAGTTAPNPPRVRFTQAAVAGTPEVEWQYDTLLRDAETAPVPPNTTALQVTFAAPALQTNPGFPPPDPGYARLALLLVACNDVGGATTALRASVYAPQSQLGDGSTIPEAIGFTSEWFPVPHDPDVALASSFLTAISQLGSVELSFPGSSYWTFTGGTAVLLLMGYEVGS